jgi:hypothetical protein
MPTFARQSTDSGWVKGCWRPWKSPRFPGPVFKDTIAFPCGGCDRLMCLPNHTISDEGRISPSVVCPHGCGWHVFLLLKDWKRVESVPAVESSKKSGS